MEYWVPSGGDFTGNVPVLANCPNDHSRGLEPLDHSILDRLPIAIIARRGRYAHVTTEDEMGDTCDDFPWLEGERNWEYDYLEELAILAEVVDEQHRTRAA